MLIDLGDGNAYNTKTDEITASGQDPDTYEDEKTGVTHFESDDARGTLCGLIYNDTIPPGDEVIDDPEEQGDVTCPTCKSKLTQKEGQQ